ncbi:hypothetical protein ACO1O0_005933 [Amphichorda felina]
MATSIVPVTSSLLGAIKNLALQPLVPGSVLLFLAYAPTDVVQRVLSSPAIQRLLGSTDARLPLRILLALGSIRVVNGFLSRWALNNWSVSAQRGWDWNGELAVVTGGSSGIGRAIVLGLVAKGVQVVVLDVQALPADMAKVSAIKHWECDMTSAEAVREAADDIRMKLGHPTIVINNAGIAHSSTILESSDAYLQKIMGVNLRALWSTAREFVPNMVLKNKGHVVTIASMASFVTIPTSVHYSATKAGALAFNEGLKCELKHFHKAPGVLTTVVHPMWVATDMTAPYADRIVKGQGPMMSPQDVADAVLKQIYSRKGGHVFVPGNVWWISIIRGLPSWMQEYMRDISAKRTLAQ